MRALENVVYQFARVVLAIAVVFMCLLVLFGIGMAIFELLRGW